MATCKVIRNTNNREIETVLVDRPLDRDLTTLISSYYESQGIPVVMDKQVMSDRLKELGYNVDAQVEAWHGSPHNFDRLIEKGIIQEVEC